MTRVTFAFNAQDRLDAVCRVAQKRFRLGQWLTIYSRDADLLERLDAHLWTFEEVSFVPHLMADHPQADHTPIVLSSRWPQVPLRPWLINLDTEVPMPLQGVAHVVEVVGLDERERQSARLRWKIYENAGLPIERHDLANRGHSGAASGDST